jgi:hypothetical protein
MNYITSKLSNLSAEGIKKWILAYFSDEIVNKIISKLTDFSSFVGWLQPIIKGTEIIFNILKPALDRLQRGNEINQISPKPSPTTESFNALTKNTPMKKTILEQLIREEIKNILELTPPTPTKDGGKIQGSFKPELFQNLMGNKFDQAKFISAMTKLKNNQSRSTNDNAFLGDLVRALMFTDDNKVLTDIFTYLKTLKTV